MQTLFALKVIVLLMLLFNMQIIKGESQPLNQILKDSLNNYEGINDLDLDIFCYDRITNSNIRQIDKLIHHDSGLHIIHFKSLIPEDYAHLLVVVNTNYLIINMHKPLEMVLSSVYNFFIENNVYNISTNVWKQIVELHYNNQVCQKYIWGSSASSYDPFENSTIDTN